MLFSPAKLPLKAGIMVFAIGAGVGALCLYRWALYKNAQKRIPWFSRFFFFLRTLSK